MIRARLTEDKATPWWAVVVPPLVGVPLMVALLAVLGPEAPSEHAVAVDEVEAAKVDWDVQIDDIDPLWNS